MTRPLAAGAVALLLASCGSRAPMSGLPPPRSIDELRAASYPQTLQRVRELEAAPGYTSWLVSYDVGPLTEYALVAVPTMPAPSPGFPVLVANHGTHPNPPRYGFTAAGADSRPGDYYRDVPAIYARHGFLVVMPDYRGHNASEGAEYAKGFLASAYYTEDVVALLANLSRIEYADTRNVFMWGHSLGGEVTLRALLATRIVRGASLWATVGGDIWDQAFYYARSRNRESLDDSSIEKSTVVGLRRDIEALGSRYDWQAREPLQFLRYLDAPVILHHAVGDPGAKYDWSERLATELYVAGRRYEFHTYPGSDHFLQAPLRDAAVGKDVAFFRKQMVR